MQTVALLLALSLFPWSDALPARRYRPRDRQVSCSQCKPEQCPPTPRCPAGRTRDACDCCWECGNREGRLCDPDAYFGTFFGRCGEGLSCRAGPRDPFSDEIPKPRCVCDRQELLCGSDDKTYENACQFRAARFRLRDRGRLTVAHYGPCRANRKLRIVFTAGRLPMMQQVKQKARTPAGGQLPSHRNEGPVIIGPPGDVTGKEGSDVIFSCKVLSYPMAVIEWRKEGNGIFLPADDTNTMVQAHGGPRRFELTGWLQIQNVQPADQGVYTCTARSPFGEVSASAKLFVLAREPQPPRPPQHDAGTDDVPDDEDYESLSSGLSY